MPIAASSYPPPTCNQTADVTVVGASVAGLSAILTLIEGGICPSRIVLLEPESLDWRASGCSRGILAPAFWHPFSRLHTSMGPDAARLLHFAADGCTQMRAWAGRMGHLPGASGGGANLFPSNGVFHLPTSDFEQREMLESVELLRAAGYPVEVLSPLEAESILGFLPQFSVAYDAAGGNFDPAAFLRRAVGDLAAQGVKIHTAVPIMRSSSSNDGAIQVEVAAPANAANREAEVQAVVRSECLIQACESNAVAISPSLSTLLTSRQERLTWLGGPSVPVQAAVIWNRGLADWHPCADGSLLVTESRPPPEFHADEIPVTRAHASASPLEIVDQKMMPMPVTADGLPLIGSNPSRADEILCLGFHGWGSTFAAAAGALAADLLINGRSDYADLFSPRRLL
jgi:glycine/D-amino acid oxidase-like deaminating enzyme